MRQKQIDVVNLSWNPTVGLLTSILLQYQWMFWNAYDELEATLKSFMFVQLSLCTAADAIWSYSVYWRISFIICAVFRRIPLKKLLI